MPPLPRCVVPVPGLRISSNPGLCVNESAFLELTIEQELLFRIFTTRGLSRGSQQSWDIARSMDDTHYFKGACFRLVHYHVAANGPEQQLTRADVLPAMADAEELCYLLAGVQQPNPRFGCCSEVILRDIGPDLLNVMYRFTRQSE
jgi:hypothetical protein